VHSSLYAHRDLRISLVRKICYDMGPAVNNSERGQAALLCMNSWTYGTYTTLHFVTVKGQWCKSTRLITKDRQFLRNPPQHIVWMRVKK
jgi:hypothetical protein